MKTASTFTAGLFALVALCLASGPSLAGSPFAGLYSGTYVHSGKITSGPNLGAPGARASGVASLAISSSGSFTGSFKVTNGTNVGSVAHLSGSINSHGVVTATATQSANGEELSGKLSGSLGFNKAGKLVGSINGKSVDQYGNVGVVINQVTLTRH